MLTRLTHAAIAFAVTVVIYQCYVLVAVPFLEPAQAVSGLAQEGTYEKPREASHNYRDLLAAYFPPGHWTLISPPKTFEDGKVMIVLDDYRSSDDGQLRINKCALLFFPTPFVSGEPAPRDAVVLEAPHGAVVQLDEGFRPGLGGIGRVQWGKLLGEITVRSDMRELGPQDDLLLTTRDLYMREDLIRTDAEVDMRLGPHRGHGRVLEIRFVDIATGDMAAGRFGSGSIESLVIKYDVEARLVPGNSQLFAAGSSNGPSPPVQVTSQESFSLHLAHSTASFKKKVQVEQVYPTGQRDRLLCDKLSLFFARQPHTSSGAHGSLRPGSIQAEGSVNAPVVLDLQTQQATARCEQMWLELQSRRVTLDGEDEVMLTYQGSEIHAPMIRYQAPAPGSTERVGALKASGNGWIRVRGDQATSTESMEMSWTKELELHRREGKLKLVVRGRPRLEMVGLGRLWAADDLEVTLRESAADGSEAHLLPSDVVPEHIVARGEIDIDSSQLRGKVNQLDVHIEYAPSHLFLGSPDGKNRRSGNLLGRRASQQARSYEIDGERLEMLLTVRDSRPEVSRIDVNGNVDFRETASIQATPEEPLVVRADQLSIENADTPSAEISLQGKPATVTVAGMSIRAERLNLNRGTSRAWIDSPGELELPVGRDLSGKALATPQRMTIHWQGGMELDQDRVTFRQGVVVQTSEGRLKTHQLTTHFSAPILFDGAARQQPVQLAQLECSGGAFAQFSQRDAAGLTSVQTVTLDETLIVNQRTGKIVGEGGGELESVHLASGANPFGNHGPANQRGQQLQFLGVKFFRGIEGNLNHRQIEVIGDVDAVYGPVDAWEQKLKKSVQGMPGPGTTWISCQRLGVAESPMARMRPGSRIGPLELSAKGDVTIEGRAGERGIFTTFSQKATYDQSKTMFVLEGDARQPATITHQEFTGAPPSETVARKFTYMHSTGEVAQIEGLVRGGWKQYDTGQKPRGLQSR